MGTSEFEESNRLNHGIVTQGFSTLAVFVLAAMITIPLLEAIGRPVAGIGIPGAAAWVQHLTLWIGLLGAVLATRSGSHISISATKLLRINRGQKLISIFIASGALCVLLSLILATLHLVYFQYESPERIGGWFPVWLAQAAMPAAFLSIAILHASHGSTGWKPRLVSVIAAITLVLIFALWPEDYRYLATIPGLVLLVFLALFGLPLYLVLGGAGLLLFYAANIPIAAQSAESYRIITQPILPSIPLFALAGTIFSAGGAPRRLVRVVRAWTSWLPGGVAISTVCGCALFTAVTGASGVTILALGGMLLPVLIAANHKKQFSIGLLTASGSVGLLFPPSLPVILYGIYGHVAIDRLFLASFIPGLLLILMLTAISVYAGQIDKVSRDQFDLKEALLATWEAKGDLFLPVMVVGGLFGGIFTLVETAALAALWAILLETVFHRELSLRRVLTQSMVEASILVGALLIVLGLASGLVSYLVDEQIPLKLTELVRSTIQSKWIFLLLLNCLLLLVGAFMDIFSAIVVVVPLIAPIGAAFGIHPVQLGVIFLANLELGYLTPPVGMNLFFSSLRFKQPLNEIWKTVIPFLFVIAAWVLLITYIPYITVNMANLLGN